LAVNLFWLTFDSQPPQNWRRGSDEMIFIPNADEPYGCARRMYTQMEVDALVAAERKKWGNIMSKQDNEIQQILGKVLGYPWFKDDQKNFPGATDENGVCVGDNVAVTLAMQAARRITESDALIAAAKYKFHADRMKPMSCGHPAYMLFDHDEDVKPYCLGCKKDEQAKDEVDALVAAAYEAAASKAASYTYYDSTSMKSAILALTPADAKAALDRRIAVETAKAREDEARWWWPRVHRAGCDCKLHGGICSDCARIDSATAAREAAERGETGDTTCPIP